METLATYGSPQIQHIAGADNTAADALSRVIIPEGTSSHEEIVLMTQVDSLDKDPTFIKRVQQALNKDQMLMDMAKVQAKNFLHKDGLLYFIDNNHHRLCIPNDNELLTAVISSCHDPPMVGHKGVKQTTSFVKMHFWFPQLNELVSKYVASCFTCQINKHSTQKRMGFLTPIPDPTELFHTFTMDFVTSLPEENGYNSIAVAIDKKSKYAILWPTSNTRTKEQRAEEFFKKVICRFGAIHKIISDRDPTLASPDYAATLKKWGCETAMTTAYRATADGQSERLIRDLRAYFRMYLKPQQSWLDLIETFEYAHNTATSESTGFTPFELVFGKVARSPIDVVTHTTIESPSMQQIATKRQAQLEAAHDNILKAQEKQAKQYNKKRREVDININDFVLIDHKALLDISERDKPINKAKALLAGPFRLAETTTTPASTTRLAASVSGSVQ